ncbi:MAG: hypothetical protein ACI8T1_001269 [Verrucomicrobiales bacterium]
MSDLRLKIDDFEVIAEDDGSITLRRVPSSPNHGLLDHIGEAG